MDARPSDAISIALLTGAPIFVAPEAFKETEIENLTRAVPKVEEANNKAIAEGILQPELTDSVEMEWRSFRSLPRDHHRVAETEFVTRISSLKRKLLRGRVLSADHRGTGSLCRHFGRWSRCGHTRIPRRLI
jgi:hypothetical protein